MTLSPPVVKRYKNCKLVTLDDVTAHIWEHAIRLNIRQSQVYSRIRTETRRGRVVKTQKPKKVFRCCVCSVEISSQYAEYCKACRQPGGKKRTPPRDCKGCGNPIIGLPKWRLFCSKECKPTRKKRNFPINAECRTCGGQFLKRRTLHMFCSERCNYLSKPKKVTPFHSRTPHKPETTGEPGLCTFCGGPMPIPRHPKKARCSDRCDKSRKHRKKAERRRTIPYEQMRDKLRNRLRDCLCKRGAQKKNSILTYLGCTPHELAFHMESQFQPPMTWGNYGVFGWHIDHIIPCSVFDLTKEEHIHACFHYTNLQPLWHTDNNLKQDSIPDEVPELLRNKVASLGIIL